MRVRGIRWAGTQTERVAEMRAFATGLLGMTVDYEDDGSTSAPRTAASTK